MAYDDSRTANRIVRDTLDERQRVLPFHDCEQSTHDTVSRKGRRLLRCTKCGATIPMPPPLVEGHEPERLGETWLTVGVVLVILWLLLWATQMVLGM